MYITSASHPEGRAVKVDAHIAYNSLRELPALARAAEQLGLDGIWFSEGFGQYAALDALAGGERRSHTGLEAASLVARRFEPGGLHRVQSKRVSVEDCDAPAVRLDPTPLAQGAEGLTHCLPGGAYPSGQLLLAER